LDLSSRTEFEIIYTFQINNTVISKHKKNEKLFRIQNPQTKMDLSADNAQKRNEFLYLIYKAAKNLGEKKNIVQDTTNISHENDTEGIYIF
jgi:hypothetical protein